MTSPLKVACIIPTYNGRHELERLLDSLGRQSAEFDTFIVDSSSRDGTFELAGSRCKNVLRIDSKDFNHGGTRQLMVERNPGYDVCVFMTQDAYLEDPDALAAIVRPFSDPQVGAVCGRQLPHLGPCPWRNTRGSSTTRPRHRSKPSPTRRNWGSKRRSCPTRLRPIDARHCWLSVALRST